MNTFLSFSSFGDSERGKRKGSPLSRSFAGSSVTLCNCEMASNNDLSLERTRGREGGRERSARNATGILRGGFAGEEEKKGEKPNVPRERERERDGLAASDVIDDDDDIGNDFARRRGERRTDVVS